MGLCNWFARRKADGLSSLRDQTPAGLDHSASIPRSWGAVSPANLLASSLIDPDTRGEWERSSDFTGYSYSTIYTNESRDLKVSVWGGLYGAGGIHTPFKLNKSDEEIVLAALRAFDDRVHFERQRDALRRLTAIATEAGTDATGTGAAEGKGAGRKASPKSPSISKE